MKSEYNLFVWPSTWHLAHSSGIFCYSTSWLIKVKNRKKKGKDKGRLGGEIGGERDRIRETVIEEKT